MPGSVVRKTLRDVRRGFTWWSAGLVGLVGLIVAAWPTVRDNPALKRLHETFPKELQAFVSFGGEFDYSTPAGYLGSELFSFMVPLLLLVAAIGAGGGALAGEEERGTLDLLLANPISRVRLALEKFAALAVEVTGLAAVLLVALVVGSHAAGMRIALAHLAAATAGALLLALAYGAVAFALGAATGRRGLAIGVSAAAAVAAYLVNTLAPLVNAIGHLRRASPFYHYSAGDPLRHGLEAGSVLFLFAVVIVASAIAVVAFDRRSLATSS